MAFWLIAVLIALIVVVVLAGTMLRPAKSDADVTATYDMQVYRDQLDELERDLARGTLGQEEAERARAEISRRVLGADRAIQAVSEGGPAPRRLTQIAIAASAVLVLGGGLGLYSQTGAILTGEEDAGLLPDVYPDMQLQLRKDMAAETRADRPTQAQAEAGLDPWHGAPDEAPADYLALVDQLRAAVAERPDDLQGHALLSNHEARLGNYIAAHQAKARVLDLKGDTISGDDYAQYADLLVLAAGGYVSPEAEAALTEALNREPKNGVARYYSGLMFAQTGRPDIGFRFWRELLEESPADALWVPAVRGQILQLAAMAGVDYTLPAGAAPMAPALAGPSAEDLAAAGDMSPEDQGAMIANMVERLSARLATEGGTAPEWAQLIKALAVLGNTQQAAAIWEEAQQVFAAIPDELEIVRQAAGEAGVEHATLPDLPMPATPEPTAETTQQMITRIADKLAREGGSAPEWAQLIAGIGSQGDTDWARAIWQEAQATFAAHPDQLAIIRDAAVAAGVAE